MLIEVSSFLGGIVVGVLLTASLVFPRIGRVLARIVSVLLFVGGVGLLVWACGGWWLDSKLTPFVIGPVTIAGTADALGWGAGLLAGGILTLVLSSLGR